MAKATTCSSAEAAPTKKPDPSWTSAATRIPESGLTTFIAEQRLLAALRAQRQQDVQRVALATVPDALGQPRDGRRGEQAADVEPDAERVLDARDQPGGEQRVPIEVEEAVGDSDPGQFEDFGEQPAERFLGRVARHVVAHRGAEVGRGQRVAVEFPVGHQRKRVDGHDRRRDHVVGQRVGDVAAQLGGLGVADDVADQPPVARPVLADHRGDLRDPGVARQHRLDLAQLDAEAADLDLVVGATGEVQYAVAAPAHEVAGAVHPRAGRAERVGHEALRGQPRLREVTVREAGARDVELADHAGRAELERVVQHVEAGARVR